jgi:hypothetical protein
MDLVVAKIKENLVGHFKVQRESGLGETPPALIFIDAGLETYNICKEITDIYGVPCTAHRTWTCDRFAVNVTIS